MRKIYWILLVLAGLVIISGWSDDEDSSYPPSYGAYGSGRYDSSGYSGYSGYSSADYWDEYNARQLQQLEQEEKMREYEDKYWEIEERRTADIGKYDIDTDD